MATGTKQKLYIFKDTQIYSELLDDYTYLIFTAKLKDIKWFNQQDNKQQTINHSDT